LAVVALYFGRLWGVFIGLPTRPEARRFALVRPAWAFLPSALLGLLLHDFIKAVLFNPVDRLRDANSSAASASSRWSAGLPRRARMTR
jgi:undecaprenyl pyrophosphate phosphatase UppP